MTLIDWQDAWAGPLFVQARHPRFVYYNGELMLRLPEHYAKIKDKEEKEQVRRQVEKSILLRSYESNTKRCNPILHEIFHFPHGKTRRETIDFSTNTWDGDILPFRECLIRLTK